MRNYRSGQSLIEILVAIGVGTIMLLGAITALSPVIKSQTDANRSQVGAALGKELLDNLKIFAEASWHNLDGLATSSVNKYFLNTATSTFFSATGTESIASGVPISGLVGHWKFDDTGGIGVMDFSENGNNGVWYGTSTVRYAAGKIGSSTAPFNGSSDYIGVPNSSSLNFGTSNFSVSFWVNRPDISAKIIIGKRTYPAGWVIYFDGNSLVMQLNNIASPNVYTLGSYASSSLGSWHHVAVVVDRVADQATYFLDGVASAPVNISATTDSIDTNTWLGIASDSSDPNSKFNGSLDEISVYDRALSATEVQGIFNAYVFTRYFYVDNVYRDSSGNIVAAGGGLDPSTKKISVEYYWGQTPPKTLTVYLSRSANKTLWQTDWSGGPGVDGPASSTGGAFSTSSGIDFATSTGSIRIRDL